MTDPTPAILADIHANGRITRIHGPDTVFRLDDLRRDGVIAETDRGWLVVKRTAFDEITQGLHEALDYVRDQPSKPGEVA